MGSQIVAAKTNSAAPDNGTVTPLGNSATPAQGTAPGVLNGAGISNAFRQGTQAFLGAPPPDSTPSNQVTQLGRLLLQA